jgi:hypothetical protein
MNYEGTILAYFFGKKFSARPSAIEVCQFVQSDVIWIRLVGDLGLLHGEWPLIDSCGAWFRSDWPMVEFGRVAVDGTWATIVTYSEIDLSTCIAERDAPVEMARKLPEDGLSGHKAAEVRLTKLLDSS